MKSLATFLFVVVGTSMVGCASHSHNDSHANPDIVDTAKSTGQFNTLLAAAEAAGLVETLKGDGPLTVFAPTDDAFAKLPAGTVENLLKPQNKDQLVSILTYHVVPGRQMAKDVMSHNSLKTVQGDSIGVMVANGMVKVDGASVVKADVNTSNGVIHVIDKVIMPSS